MRRTDGLDELAAGMGIIVAIDGPAGSGKSTVARTVAERLGFTRLDTGAMYRAVTLVAIERGVSDPEDLAELARAIPLRFDGTRVFVEDREVTEAIRSTAVTQNVSAVAAVPGVRAGLLERQRALGRSAERGAVLEGRDIGTVVFPDADIKVFLTASPEERALRRHREMAAAGRDGSYENVLEDIRERDRRDGSRSVAPLKPAEDAVHVDTTGRTFDEVVAQVIDIVRARTAQQPDNRFRNGGGAPPTGAFGRRG